MGNPLDGRTQLGPLMTAARLAGDRGAGAGGEAAGATVVCGGEKVTKPGLEQGNFMAPTILTGVTRDMAVAKEELFGPVLCVHALPARSRRRSRWPTTPTSAWRATCGATTSRRSHHIAQALDCGNVFLNAYGYQSEIPFGGTKLSGIGREHGVEAMREYTQVKSVTVGMERFKSRFDV